MRQIISLRPDSRNCGQFKASNLNIAKFRNDNFAII